MSNQVKVSEVQKGMRVWLDGEPVYVIRREKWSSKKHRIYYHKDSKPIKAEWALIESSDLLDMA